MTFDGFVMAAVVAEMQSALGAFVDQVYQPDAARVVLALTGRGPRRFWLFSVAAAEARCHLVSARPETPDTPPTFCMLLRKHLRGAHLEAVEQPQFDRVGRLTFARGDERPALVHEVMGRHSNLMLLNEAGTVLGAIKIVPPSRSRARPILPGSPYELAPTTRTDPRTVTHARFMALAAGEAIAPEWFVRTFNGFGPFAAAELLARAGGSHPDALWSRFEELVGKTTRGEFAPVLFRDPEGAPAGCWAFPSVQQPPDRQERVGSISFALETFYRYREETGSRERLRADLHALLDGALQAGRRQREEAERHLAGLDGAETLRISGELLLGARDLPRGAPAVELPNYYDADQAPLRIELDPELSARENAERYFRRYRRAVAAAERAVDRLPAVEARLVRLEAAKERVAAADAPGLAALKDELAREGLARPEPRAGAADRGAKETLPPGIRIRHYRLDDWEVLWGENAPSNDYLTTRLARPADLWLHARAVTGAHVVVRAPRRDAPVPRTVLEAAARTAAAHSDAKHSSVIPVDYTQRRYVRKPRGSAPGAVTYQNEKTLHVSAAEPEEGVRVD
jgi:predicted ribosome quality control (RQC) complex YloA/Tae2 family protein